MKITILLFSLLLLSTCTVVNNSEEILSPVLQEKSTLSLLYNSDECKAYFTNTMEQIPLIVSNQYKAGAVSISNSDTTLNILVKTNDSWALNSIQLHLASGTPAQTAHTFPVTNRGSLDVHHFDYDIDGNSDSVVAIIVPWSSSESTNSLTLALHADLYQVLTCDSDLEERSIEMKIAFENGSKDLQLNGASAWAISNDTDAPDLKLLVHYHAR